MLIGAKELGFEIPGNIEWRKYYHTPTFEKNFGSPLFSKMEDMTDVDIKRFKDADIAFGHPECGNFSNLRVKKTAKLNDPGDIPLFTELVKQFRPKFFAMDNLPKAIIAYPVSRWVEELGDTYDLFPEWVSNYHYGNTQINRKRFFMIGARKEYEYVFKAGEVKHDRRLGDAIMDLPGRSDIYDINHNHWKGRDIMRGWGRHNFDLTRETPGKNGGKVSLAEFKRVIRHYPSRKNFAYYNRFGEAKLRPGYSKIDLENYSPVLSGGGSAPDNHYRSDTLNPLTMRERLRVQGAPDDFILYPLDYMKDFKTYVALYKQTGKFMPVEFNKFFAAQVEAHLKGKPFKCSGERFLNQNPFINEGKREGCKPHSSHCQKCWLTEDCGHE
jgi:site-specific DNA-cytosine methylase